jgi:glucose-1-phosphate cytidylyltransferase
VPERRVKAVILAGGLGTRLSEETDLLPKPMVTIGGMPILWHIMKIYHSHNVDEFVVCLGYKGYVIKEYFANYALHAADVTIDLSTGDTEFRRRGAEPWRITLIDTGRDTMTGGRLGRIRDLVDETFLVTYGDGVGDVDISGSIEFHKQHGKLATMTAVVPPGRYGALELDGDGAVMAFREKPAGDGGMINGGYFVLEPEVLDRVSGDESIFEEEVLPGLAADGQLAAFEHSGFWRPMDTVRDRRQLEEAWASGDAPWKVWSD